MTHIQEKRSQNVLIFVIKVILVKVSNMEQVMEVLALILALKTVNSIKVQTLLIVMELIIIQISTLRNFIVFAKKV